MKGGDGDGFTRPDRLYGARAEERSIEPRERRDVKISVGKKGDEQTSGMA
jgi:hypothetical protein